MHCRGDRGRESRRAGSDHQHIHLCLLYTSLDIRSIDEQEDKPLKVEGVEVVSLPFYKLSTKFGDLDQSKTWLLW